MSDCIRSGRRESFTVLYNSMITDQRLSLKAKGLFAVMMSRPDDWEFSVSGLAAFAGVGKDTIRSTLAELEKVGYLIRAQAHDSGGKFAGNIYVLQDTAPPLSGNPDDGKNRQRESTLSENPTQQKKDYNERKTKNTPIPPEGAERKAARKNNNFPLAHVSITDAIDDYIGDDPEYRAAFLGFLENRALMKKPINTTRAINGIINKLRKVNHRETEIAMLDNATLHNWLSVFPLKEDELPAAGAPAYNEEGQDGI